MRLQLFLFTLFVGLALAITGFFLAAPIGSPDGPSISDPRVPFAPGLFVIGVILMFGSAAVYELIPGKGEE